jgi:hypothetical protein
MHYKVNLVFSPDGGDIPLVKQVDFPLQKSDLRSSFCRGKNLVVLARDIAESRFPAPKN